MCNEYARDLPLDQLEQALSQTKLPPFGWENGRIPNDLNGKASVKIRDTAPIVRLRQGRLVGTMATWAWLATNGKPVFNFVSDGRDFAASDRVLILATAFYEYTAPSAPRVKLKDQHLFTMAGEPWFWIAGIVKDGCFTMLTTAPGADVAPYHDRQIVTLAPADGLGWLSLFGSPNAMLRVPDAGTLEVRTLRTDGAAVG